MFHVSMLVLWRHMYQYQMFWALFWDRTLSDVMLWPLWGISGLCQVISHTNSSESTQLFPGSAVCWYLSVLSTSQLFCQAGGGDGGVDDAYCTKSHLQTPQVIIPSRNCLVNSANLPKTIQPLLLIAQRDFFCKYSLYKMWVIYTCE